MNIETVSIPPISYKFYTTLLSVFPPMSGLDVKKDTSVIELHRRAAQDEVLQYISAVVRHPEPVHEVRDTIWSALRRTVPW